MKLKQTQIILIIVAIVVAVFVFGKGFGTQISYGEQCEKGCFLDGNCAGNLKCYSEDYGIPCGDVGGCDVNTPGVCIDESQGGVEQCDITPDQCTDSDGENDADLGRDPFNKGTAQTDTGSATDYCVNDVDLKEYYCSGSDAYVGETIDCRDYGDYYCYNGECVQPGNCVDSDSNLGGDIEFTKGHTYIDGLCIDETCDVYDSCSGDTLTEYYCSGGTLIKSYPVSCAFGCSNGACIETTDECISDSDCGTDEECYYGTCVEKQTPECTDSDGGQVPGEKGVVSFDGNTYEDACVNTEILQENWCEGGVVKAGSISCSSIGGSTCNNGECSGVPTCSEGKTLCNDGTCKTSCGTPPEEEPECTLDSECSTGLICKDSGKCGCENFWEDPKSECAVLSWLWYVLGAIAALIAIKLLGKK